MIVYPLIILGLLLSAFIIVYKKALDLERGNIVSRQGVKEEKEIDLTQDLSPSFKKAESLFKKKQYISAEKWYIESVKEDPKNDMIYARLGVIYIEQGNFKDAKEALEESIKYDPSVASRYYNLSYAEFQLGDVKASVASARKALRLDPKSKKYKKWLEQIQRKPY